MVKTHIRKFVSSSISLYIFICIILIDQLLCYFKRSMFIPIPKRAKPINIQTTSQLRTFCMLARKCSRTFKLVFSSMSTENFPEIQAGFRKGRGARDQIANIHRIIEKARQFQKNIYFCFIDHTKAFDCVDLNKLWKILKETGITDHFTCLLRKPYAGQEATVRTGHGKMDCSNLEKEYVKAVYCHPDFNLGFPAGSDGKESTCNAGDMGSSPRLERSLYMHSTSCERSSS